MPTRGETAFHLMAFGISPPLMAGSHFSNPGTAGSLTASTPSLCQSKRRPALMVVRLSEIVSPTQADV